MISEGMLWFLKIHLQLYKMLILVILFFLHKEVNAYSHLRNDVSHTNYYDTSRIFDHNNRMMGYNGMDYNRRRGYTGIHNNIGRRYTGLYNDIGTRYTGIDNNLQTEYAAIENDMGTKFTGMDKKQSSLIDLLIELSTLFTSTEENTILTDIVDLVKYVETHIPTQLSEFMGLLRAIYVLIHESLSVYFGHLPKNLPIVNDIFKFLSSVLTGKLIEDITNQLEADQGLYAIPQKMISQLSDDGAFSNDLLAAVGNPLLEIVSKLNSWATEVLEHISPLLPFEELHKILELGANKTSLNETSESASTTPGNMYGAYQNTLKLYPKLDELTTGTVHHHLSKSLFKVMTRLLKHIYNSN